MSEREIPTPENCPEPFWHDTHYYCPCCSWEAPDRPLSEVERLRADNERLLGDHVAYSEQITSLTAANAELTLQLETEKGGPLVEQIALLKEVNAELTRQVAAGRDALTLAILVLRTGGADELDCLANHFEALATMGGEKCES